MTGIAKLRNSVPPTLKAQLHAEAEALTAGRAWICESVCFYDDVTVDGPMMPRPGSIVSRGSGSPKAAHCAVTIARSFSDTFAGIRPVDAPGFILAQLIAVVLALPLLRAPVEAKR